jgi:phosphate starvation-inducible protein PhoH and related proteins
MSSLPHTADVYQMKRKPKNPIKFNVQLNEEQKKAKAVLLHNPITVLRGGAGSGKTLLAAQAALDLLFSREVNKIIITRPTVSKEDIGFLPGDIREKMDPWLAPIYHNLYMLYNKEKIDKEVEKGTIEIVPFAFIRGRTFVDSFVIVDEAQNVTHTQMQAVIGRLGKNSKMVICGDIAQIDLRDKRTSGFLVLK